MGEVPTSNFVPLFFGDLRVCRGDVAFPPTCRPPRRQGEAATSDFVPLCWGTHFASHFLSFFFGPPHFVAWPLELGLGTHNTRFVAWPLELGLGWVWRIELVMGYPFARHANGTSCKWVAGKEGVRSQSCSGSTENEGPSDHCQQVASDKDLLRLKNVALGGLKKQTSVCWALAPL